MTLELYPEFETILTEFESGRLLLDQVERMRLFTLFESKALEEFSEFEVIEVQSVAIESLIHNCTFRPLNLRFNPNGLWDKSIKCESMVSILKSIYNRRKCFTYFADLFDLNSNYSEWLSALKSQFRFAHLLNNVGISRTKILGH